MKRKNVRNNVENKIHFTWSYFDIKDNVGAGLVPAQRGITLIALIITIILMLILAGVVLNLTIGENGIFNVAKYAVNKWNNATKQEQAELDELYAYINSENLPENTKDTEAGTLVAVPDNWKTETPAYVSTPDGKEVVSSKKISTVQAVAIGNGETVPVPIGFWYVGGNKTSGVVISDNKKDQNKYANMTNVPDGAVYDVTTGKLKQESELTDEERKTVLYGNQFVWIPCSEEEYTKYNWENASFYYDTSTNIAELGQIRKYGGFYVGRYEAGTSNIELKNGYTWETPKDTNANGTVNTWDNLNYTHDKVIKGNITTKAGEIPYFHADYETAIEMSKKMYNTNTVYSGLMTGTMWDVMLNYISEETDKSVNNASNSNKYLDLRNSPWGNHSVDTNLTYTQGRGRYININNTGVENGSFTVSDTAFHYGIRTCGFSEDAKKKNIYDLAGNLFEFTQESAYISSVYSVMYIGRGGSFGNSNNVCSRVTFSGFRGTHHGFRPVLYIK